MKTDLTMINNGNFSSNLYDIKIIVNLTEI